MHIAVYDPSTRLHTRLCDGLVTEIIPPNSSKNPLKAECIKCAKIKLAQYIVEGDTNAQRDICIRFKIRPGDIL